jgi:hypothetical protein
MDPVARLARFGGKSAAADSMSEPPAGRRTTMQLVAIYAAGAALSAAMAYFSGPATPVLVYWLYVAGAVFFAIGAAGQYFKVSKPSR